MKAYGGVDVWAHVFLSSALVGGEWSTSRPGRFTPGERPLCTHWVRVWVDPRAGLDVVEQRKISLASAGNRTLAFQPVTRRFID
jgi:hypothetical protein